MKFKPPAGTRDSGVRWLGEIPTHWGVVQSRRLFSERNEKAKEGEQQLTVSQRYGLVSQSAYMELEGRRVVQVLKGHDILKHVQAGDFVMSMRSFQGGLEYSTLAGSVSSAYVPLKTIKWVYPEYFRYLFKSSTYIQELQSTSDLVRDGQALRFENFSKVALPVVPMEEQAAISSQLDRATRRIDALIAKKTRFIEFLGEKRHALTTHAVTKGLDAGVPMKDSGVEWLGMIPAKWTTKRLRFVCDVTTGGKDTVNATPDGKFPFYVRSQEVERIDTYSADCEAVLTAGDGAGVGKVYHYANGKFDFHQRVYMMHNFRGVRGKFFYHYLRSLFAAVALDGGAKSTVDSLRMPVFKNFQITVPSLLEQDDVVVFIQERSSRIDALIAKTERSIELLREHRTALITAAVTGKIDLREAV